MASLILEGGTFRPIFSAGVMDAFLDYDIMFPYIIGVSAGITNGFSYVSKQKGRNLDILMKYRLDKRYLSKRNFIKEKSIFGITFAFEEIPNHLLPFDVTTFRKYQGALLVGVTNANTGKAEYLNGLDLDEKNTMIKATCSIPGVFPVCILNGQEYYDGGIADSICIQKAIDDGNQKHLIILTQPKGFKKEASKKTSAIAYLLRKKYPKLATTMLNRHHQYNQSLAIIQLLQKENLAYVIQPSIRISSFEKDTAILKSVYTEGYQYVVDHIAEIKQFLNE